MSDTEVGDKARQIPTPSGFHILCMVPHVEDVYENGILKADSTVRVEEHSTIVLFVAELGPDAYSDKTRFPSGPWCRKGDFVLVRAYSGTRLKIHGTEWRIINDDTVDGVVEDPRGLGRAN